MYPARAARSEPEPLSRGSIRPFDKSESAPTCASGANRRPVKGDRSSAAAYLSPWSSRARDAVECLNNNATEIATFFA